MRRRTSPSRRTCCSPSTRCPSGRRASSSRCGPTSLAGPELLDRLRRLREHGYRLALDGSTDDADEELLALARAVKLRPSQAHQVRDAKARGLTTIAVEVASPEERDQCVAAGFDLFQGNFLARPRAVRAAPVPAVRLERLKAATRLGAGEGFDELERAIGQDPALSLRLLRFVNSAAVGLRHEVRSVRQATVLLGERTVRQWLALVLVCGDEGPPGPLTITGLARARTCEAVARRLGDGEPEVHSLVGLLSVADGLLDTPMPEVVAELPLPGDVAEALLHRGGVKGRVLALAEACEQGDFQAAQELGLDPGLVAALHAAALRWADAIARGRD